MRRSLLLLPSLIFALIACDPPKPAVSISPTNASVGSTETAQFTATTSNLGSSTVNWFVNDVPSGNATVGTITTNGLYTAPLVNNNTSFVIKAVSAADATKFATATVAVAIRQGISGTVSISNVVPFATSAFATAQSLSTQAVSSTAKNTADWSAPHVRGQVLVLSPDGTVSTQSISRLQALGAKHVGKNISKLDVPAGRSEQEYAETIARDTGLVVQPNYLFQLLATPNDPQYTQGNQSYMNQIQMPLAWDVQRTGALVAVIDSGVDLTHPELTGHLVAAKDFCARIDQGNCLGEDNDPTDTSGHGTNVTGLIGASVNNGSMMAGVIWSGAQIIPIKIFENGQGGSSVDLAAAIRYAADQGAKVINMSVGFNGLSTNLVVDAAIDYADSKDVLMVASSGNTKGPVYYPANNPKILAVGSVDATNTVSGFSARGPEQGLVAPGEAILSLNKGGGLANWTGTSESAPLVSGVAALVRANNPSLTAAQTKNILLTTAKDLGAAGRDDTYGYGLVQARAALDKAGGVQKYQVIVFADYADSTTDSRGGQTASFLVTRGSSATYQIKNSRNGALLPAGPYTVSACVDLNSNNLCDAGDTLSAASKVQYDGRQLTVDLGF